MAARGWYSGDTHVHRALDELPNVLLAEDLNVALPLSYWVRDSGVAPTSADPSTRGQPLNPELITVDPTHVIYPINTEYEIFRVGKRDHTLGAVFVLNHKSSLPLPAPPVRPIAEIAREQGALLDLDKHSWPWSLMLVPVMDVDLFELSNNHVWQTEFGFPAWTRETAADWMGLRMTEDGFTEQSWIEFGFKTYYALLNCGFRLRVTAGTASGVHPVQLGFGRVYVYLPDGFKYADWMAGLNSGHSFVSTGPMLEVKFNGKDPGHIFKHGPSDYVVHIKGSATSWRPLKAIEIVVNGDVLHQLPIQNTARQAGGVSNAIETTVSVAQSSWIAVRCFENHPGGRVRFAHTNPVHIDVTGRPLRPKRREVDYLVGRMEEELQRNESVLSTEALYEYRQALRSYQGLRENAQ